MKPPNMSNRLIFRRGEFRLYWLAHAGAQFGAQVAQFSLPLLALRLLKASPGEIGLITSLQWLPYLVIGLPAGAWLDRIRKKPILVSADIVRTVIIAGIASLGVTGMLTIPIVYGLAVLIGVANVFFGIGATPFLRYIVPSEELAEANSSLQFTASLARFTGPALAGLMVGVASTPAALGVTAVMYLASALLILGVRVPSDKAASQPKRNLLADIRFGLQWLIRHQLVVSIIVAASLANLFSGALLVSGMHLVYGLEVLGFSEPSIGTALSLGAAGGIIGSLIAIPVGKRIGIGRAFLVSMAVFGLGFLAWLYTGSGAYAVFTGAFFIAQAGFGCGNVLAMTIIQVATPVDVLGRVGATMQVGVWGGISVGSALGGFLAELLGLQHMIAVLSLLFVASLSVLISAGVHHVRSTADIGENNE